MPNKSPIRAKAYAGEPVPATAADATLLSRFKGRGRNKSVSGSQHAKGNIREVLGYNCFYGNKDYHVVDHRGANAMSELTVMANV